MNNKLNPSVTVEINKEFKSPIELKMKNMIENIEKY